MIAKAFTDFALIQQVMVERLKAGYVKNFDADFVALESRLRDLITGQRVEKLSELSRMDLNRLLVRIKAAHNEIMGDALDRYLVEMPDLAATVAQMEASAIATAIIGAVRVPLASAAYQAALQKPIESTGQFMMDFVKGWPAKDIEHINGAVRNAWGSGKTLMQTVRAVNNQIDTKTRQDLGAVIHTATQNVATSARFETYAKNPDIVKKFRWLSTLDRKTCLKCQPRDGQEYPLDYEPRPGNVHIRCRCASAPVVHERFMVGATRASAGPNGTGYVDAKLDYYGWIKTQPIEYQELALGVRRSKLLRDGGLTGDQFRALNLGRDFEPMTLSEMKEKAPAAFQKAGLN